MFSVIIYGIRRRPTLPGRCQPSTISAERLNFCVRYGNRWDPLAITTGNCILFIVSDLLSLPSGPPFCLTLFIRTFTTAQSELT